MLTLPLLNCDLTFIVLALSVDKLIRTRISRPRHLFLREPHNRLLRISRQRISSAQIRVVDLRAQLRSSRKPENGREPVREGRMVEDDSSHTEQGGQGRGADGQTVRKP